MRCPFEEALQFAGRGTVVLSRVPIDLSTAVLRDAAERYGRVYDAEVAPAAIARLFYGDEPVSSLAVVNFRDAASADDAEIAWTRTMPSVLGGTRFRATAEPFAKDLRAALADMRSGRSDGLSRHDRERSEHTGLSNRRSHHVESDFSPRSRQDEWAGRDSIPARGRPRDHRGREAESMGRLRESDRDSSFERHRRRDEADYENTRSHRDSRSRQRLYSAHRDWSPPRLHSRAPESSRQRNSKVPSGSRSPPPSDPVLPNQSRRKPLNQNASERSPTHDDKPRESSRHNDMSSERKHAPSDERSAERARSFATNPDRDEITHRGVCVEARHSESEYQASSARYRIPKDRAKDPSRRYSGSSPDRKDEHSRDNFKRGRADSQSYRTLHRQMETDDGARLREHRPPRSRISDEFDDRDDSARYRDHSRFSPNRNSYDPHARNRDADGVRSRRYPLEYSRDALVRGRDTMSDQDRRLGSNWKGEWDPYRDCNRSQATDKVRENAGEARQSAGRRLPSSSSFDRDGRRRDFASPVTKYRGGSDRGGEGHHGAYSSPKHDRTDARTERESDRAYTRPLPQPSYPENVGRFVRNAVDRETTRLFTIIARETIEQRRRKAEASHEGKSDERAQPPATDLPSLEVPRVKLPGRGEAQALSFDMNGTDDFVNGEQTSSRALREGANRYPLVPRKGNSAGSSRRPGAPRTSLNDDGVRSRHRVKTDRYGDRGSFEDDSEDLSSKQPSVGSPSRSSLPPETSSDKAASLRNANANDVELQRGLPFDDDKDLPDFASNARVRSRKDPMRLGNRRSDARLERDASRIGSDREESSESSSSALRGDGSVEQYERKRRKTGGGFGDTSVVRKSDRKVQRAPQILGDAGVDDRRGMEESTHRTAEDMIDGADGLRSSKNDVKHAAPASPSASENGASSDASASDLNALTSALRRATKRPVDSENELEHDREGRTERAKRIGSSRTRKRLRSSPQTTETRPQSRKAPVQSSSDEVPDDGCTNAGDELGAPRAESSTPIEHEAATEDMRTSQIERDAALAEQLAREEGRRTLRTRNPRKPEVFAPIVERADKPKARKRARSDMPTRPPPRNRPSEAECKSISPSTVPDVEQMSDDGPPSSRPAVSSPEPEKDAAPDAASNESEDIEPALEDRVSEDPQEFVSARTMGYVKEQWKKRKAAIVPEELEARMRATFLESNANQVEAGNSARGNRQELRKLRNELRQVTRGTETMTVNQLKQRTKNVMFGKSRIHGMGLYACENIPAGEFVIEYVGEKVRRSVADLREKIYTRQGMGDSYLFRLDARFVIDATRKGSIARFINHSCDPNLIARIISVSGEDKIAFYSKRAVRVSEELTYDYKFEFEDDDAKVACYCSAATCRRFLN